MNFPNIFRNNELYNFRPALLLHQGIKLSFYLMMITKDENMKQVFQDVCCRLQWIGLVIWPAIFPESRDEVIRV